MKLYAPKYYKDFVCIADKCTHNCCIGWEIDIDPDTQKMYESLMGGYGQEIKKSIEYGETPHFKLSLDGRCPHLASSGLCKIILELGEDHLCDICREHPRFYNDTPRGTEVGLGMACEEAARLILSSDGYEEIYEVGETCGESEADFDTLDFRRNLYSLLSDGSLPYPEKLQKIHEKYGVSPFFLTDCEWRALISSLEYLDPSHRNLFSCYSSDTDTPKEAEKLLERSLAYFVYRHCTSVFDSKELYAALGFSLFCERLLASLIKEYGTDGAVRLARIVSEEIEYSEDNTKKIKNKF